MADKSLYRHSRYVDPVIDYGFKIIFTDEQITRGFLNDLLQSKGIDLVIEEVTICENEASEYAWDKRKVIFDVHCRANSGEEFVIEMQNESQDYFSDRVVFYMSRATSRQQKKGFREVVNEKGKTEKMPWDYHMKNIYGVFFMNFKDEKRPKPLSHCALMDTDDKVIDSEIFQYWKIQLPFYREMKESDCKTIMDKWFYILANMSTMETALPFIGEKPLFMRLAEIAEYSALTEAQQMQYDESLDDYCAYYNSIERRERKAREQAYQEAHQEALRSALGFYALGTMSIEQIAQIMKLDVEELKDYIIDNSIKS